MSDKQSPDDVAGSGTGKRLDLAVAKAADQRHDRPAADGSRLPPSGVDAVPATPGSRLPPPRSGGAVVPGNAGSVLGNAGVHLHDYMRVLYKRRWIAVTAFLFVFLSVAIYTFTAIPIYESRVQILIEKESTNVVNFKEAVEQNRIADDYYQTQYKILQSRALARMTMDVANLWDNPQFNPKKKGVTVRGVIAAPAALLSSLTAPRRQESTGIETPEATATPARNSAVDRFLGSLRVSPVRNSRLVDVTFSSPDPAQAANIANTLAAAYIDQNLEVKFQSSKQASDWLGQRLAEQRQQVQNSALALQQYREQTDSVSVEDKENIVVQKLADLNAAVTRAHTETLQKATQYNQIQALHADLAGLDTFSPILSNTFVQQQKSELAELQRQRAQLSDKLGPRHPDMLKIDLAIQTVEAKIQTEVSKVILSTRNEYEAARTQEQNLIGALQQQKRDALALARKGIDYRTLERDAASNQHIFDNLMERTKETGISTELRTSNIRIIDPAEVPGGPSSPNTRLNLLLALFGGVGLAGGLAFFLEYLDDRIKTPDEVETQLGLSFIGMVPALFGNKVADPLMDEGVALPFSEAFRSIRSNVLFSSADDGAKVVVVTSTAPGEGKTLVATNLAVALAQAGQQVLILDGDMRKPRVHGIFQHQQEPGLSNVLVGDAKASEALRTTRVSGLWAMPAGMIPPNPSELLGSQRFRDFVGTLGQQFDWVIIDSPPVMAVTDSAIVAHISNGVVFVVGSAMTSRHAAKRSLDQLRNANAKIIGAVLNRVDLEHHGYYYSQYYRKEYTDSYMRAAS